MNLKQLHLTIGQVEYETLRRLPRHPEPLGDGTSDANSGRGRPRVDGRASPGPRYLVFTIRPYMDPLPVHLSDG